MRYKTEDEILKSMLLKAQEKELISTADDLIQAVENGEQTENQYVLDLATHAFILAEFNQNLEELYDSFDVAQAVGQQLDRLGNLVNVPRLPAMPAQLEIQVHLDIPGASDITVPAGTRVLIDPLQKEDYINYYTDTLLTIPAGATDASVMCSSDMLAVQPRIPPETVYGLEGFESLQVTNYDHSTRGKNLEEDRDYRQRILLWNTQNERGTRASFEAYLGTYQGIDDYKIIPQPEGLVGTMDVVCDCIESMRYEIEDGLVENCVLYTDDRPNVIMVSPTNFDVQVTCTVDLNTVHLTYSELQVLITGQVEVYINGGTNRNGAKVKGLGIGGDFIPSQLVSFLHQMFPELTSVTCATQETEVDDYHKLQSATITVEVS